ncbi:MAG: hypothetical protein BWY84_00455 [Candidatus Aerophobetes bacterium ADurb.Bin490]|nr:MAG: hypothetical protein BWY84_00455 [Candidatus Aerophobetes bacterium ADurb.Bin490]HNZ28498.1 YqzL family protein [Candidatus Goldiibacteriota bacterium]HPI03016.1 YqzL family protein [Candidatus Goldiibacteriota bacterium]HPN64223.1 YqzL family protein [Candidatus Goldiibacteriota bacterium]HRQ43140.1 YqzL family protein [Candidatus Goldiibacteriota bacterium]
METKTGSERRKELWRVFEKTGSIGAYLLYMEAGKKSEEKKKENELDGIKER